MFSPATRNVRRKSLKPPADRQAQGSDRDAPATPLPSFSSPSNRPTTGTPAPWSSRLSFASRYLIPSLLLLLNGFYCYFLFCSNILQTTGGSVSSTVLVAIFWIIILMVLVSFILQISYFETDREGRCIRSNSTCICLTVPSSCSQCTSKSVAKQPHYCLWFALSIFCMVVVI